MRSSNTLLTKVFDILTTLQWNDFYTFSVSFKVYNFNRVSVNPVWDDDDGALPCYATDNLMWTHWGCINLVELQNTYHETASHRVDIKTTTKHEGRKNTLHVTEREFHQRLQLKKFGLGLETENLWNWSILSLPS